MTQSRNPIFIHHREKFRTEVDRTPTDPHIMAAPLAEMCDAHAYMAKMGFRDEPSTVQDLLTMIEVAASSVIMERDIVDWMRANPTAVEAIMRGAKK